MATRTRTYAVVGYHLFESAAGLKAGWMEIDDPDYQGRARDRGGPRYEVRRSSRRLRRWMVVDWGA